MNLIVFFFGVTSFDCFFTSGFLQHKSLNMISAAIKPTKPIAIAKLGDLIASAMAYLIFLFKI